MTPRSRTPPASGARISAGADSAAGSPSSSYSHTTVVVPAGAAARTPGTSRTADRVPSGSPPSAGAVTSYWARVPVRVSSEVAASTVVWVRVYVRTKTTPIASGLTTPDRRSAYARTLDSASHVGAAVPGRSRRTTASPALRTSAGPHSARPIAARMPATDVTEAPRTVRDSSGTTDSAHAPRTSSSPVPVRVREGVRGSLRDSATASVAGIREVRQAAHRAQSRTAATTRSSVASAGNGLTVRGSSGGRTPRPASRSRKRPASR